MIETIVSLAFVAQVLRHAAPYALAAMGGALTERAGVIDLALEAKLLFGAFSAAALGHATGSATAALVGGIAAGMLVAGIQVLCALRLGADQVIVGIALNVLALGGTRFGLQLLYGESANSPPVPTFGSSGVANPVIWLAVLAAVATPIAVARTRWGLRLRAAGDRPESLVAVGVAPWRPRLAAALVGGALAGAGGAQLTLSVGVFVADMSGGRGYMALAMVILAGWRPRWAAIACVGFAAAEAISIQLQLADLQVLLVDLGVPHALAQLALYLVQLAPYVLTLVVLIVWGGTHGRPPRSLGR